MDPGAREARHHDHHLREPGLRVLLEELKGVGAADTGPKALSMMDPRDPTLNWLKLAEGMGIAAVQVDGVRALADAVRSSIGSRGPKLIEAIM